MSLPVDEIVAVLRDHVDSPTLQAIAKDLLKVEADNKRANTSEKPNRTKSRFVVLLRSEDEAVIKAVQAGAYLVSTPDDETTDTYHGKALLQRLDKAVAHHNDNPPRGRGKGKHRVIKTLAEAMEGLKGKALAATDSPKLKIRTKLPVEIVVVSHEQFPLS